ncbi:MAG: universal stress protein [Anaerolineales bacterium]|nr:universal stress protein [Anaerolineales bacterium]
MPFDPKDNEYGFSLARADFQHARQRASLQEVVSRLTGKSADLLSFEEVREKLHAIGTGVNRGVQNIPLDSIVGSVGRYTDFSRTFLPKNPSDEERWAKVMTLVTDPQGGGLPPIEVIKLGDVYFVQDGHHRVSVARQLGAQTIEAYVNEITTKVPLSPDSDPEDLILKEEFAVFLETTRLKKTRPDADLELTVPGMYEDLLDHIQVHKYFTGLNEKRDVPTDEAAAHWYDNVYRPVVEAIRERNLLREFPGRTETDLYLWVSEHRAELQQGLGDFISPVSAAQDLADKFGTRAGRVAARIGKSLARAVVPDALESGPPTGAWRESKADQDEETLFGNLLVAISGEDAGWTALDQALIFARRESSRIHGLHVLRGGKESGSQKMDSLREAFTRRCEQAGLTGGLAIEESDVTDAICDRARLVDLVVLTLTHPPADQPFLRLSSGFRALIQKCPRPILAIPADPTELSSALVAYDGGAKSKEALFVAAYLASRWKIPLTVLSVEESGVDAEDILEEADEYLHTRSVRASLILRAGPVAEAILRAAGESGSQLLILGGYGSNPVLEAVLGSQVDSVLRQSRLPMLICR